MTDRECPTCHDTQPEDRFNDRWPDCFRCRVRSLRLQPSAAPTSADPNLFRQLTEERTLNRDGDAYKRLRAQGFQPKAINGSADLETHATSRFEIESGRLFDNASTGSDALNWFSDTFQHEATTPVTTPVTDSAA